MNQQQLQTARAALWHQNAAPLATYDDAAAWLEETGLCLFLPRHAQLPAPAPSLVEATMGAPGTTPAAGAVAAGMELAARLIDAGRAIPLNLLGTYSEQPDFLIAPEVLPWVAAIRGDRQWKTAPGGRAAPIVLRTWEALERQGAQTAVEVREILGRELTEAAVLRALIELWTSLRALPAYTPGEPTRWSLTKDRYAAQLATGASTAQPTALSALLSLYLRSAVAATAEEAEVFLSPLTARSRIREVLHGMTAARQFGTMSVGSQTLLFVEGSLPETAPEAEAALAPAAGEASPALPAKGHGREPREARKDFRGQRRGEPRSEPRSGPRFEPGSEPRSGPRSERGSERGFERPRDLRPPRREFRPGAGARKEAERGGGPGREGRPSRPFDKKRVWQPRERKPGFAGAGGEREGERRGRGAGKGGAEKGGAGAGARGARPWQKRGAGERTGGKPGAGEFRGRSREGREGRRPFPAREGRVERPQGEGRPWQKNRRSDGGREDRQPQRRGGPPFRSHDGPSGRRDRPSGPAEREERGREERGRPEFRPRRDFGSRGFDRSRSGDRPERGKGGPVRLGGSGGGGDFPGKARRFDPAKRGAGGGERGKPRFGGPRRASEPEKTRGPEKTGREESGLGKSGMGKFGQGKSGMGKFGPGKAGPGKFGPKKFGSSRFGPARGASGGFGKRSGRGEFQPGKKPGKNFPGPGARGEQKSRKNRSQEESPE